MKKKIPAEPVDSAAKASCVDLHLHSKYSNRPSAWFLRRIGAPESFMEPVEIYRRCRAAGMDFVTISDHNCIQGALDIAELPGTFISSELTTYFPEDGAKLHCLVWGITPRVFEDLQQARENIYDLQAYLVANQIVHAVAHPLFRVNERLTVAHVEKLIVMFNRFEGLNGSRHGRACAVTRAILDALDEATLMRLADRHGLAPVGPTPWKKSFTGGSDDHGGLHIAGAYTVTPQAKTVQDYLEHLRAGRHQPGGADGSSLQLAHSLMHIAHSYVRQRLGHNRNAAALVSGILQNLSGELDAKSRPVSPLRATFRRLVTPIVRRHKMRQLSEVERLLLDEFQSIVGNRGGAEAEGSGLVSTEERFALVSKLVHQLGYTFVKRALEQLKAGSLLEAVQSLGALSPVLLGAAPYFTAFSIQHKDNAFIRELCEQYPAGRGPLRGRGGKAWVTDTFTEVNGVAHTIHKLATMAQDAGTVMTVLACTAEPVEAPFPLRTFAPVGSFSFPEYPEVVLAVPPVLDVIRAIEQGDFDELLISTPGPMGLTALLAARLLGIPAKGIYHTDFPHYITTWTDDEAMGDLTRRLMCWFYGKMEQVYAPTEAYVEELVALGLERERLRVLPRGVDLSVFSPRHREDGFWNRYGLNGSEFKFLYVGRISSEKNIEVMLEAFRLLSEEGHSIELAVVGDGPDLPRLKALHGGRHGLTFTGYLRGLDLSKAYASAHALVFPSMSDTFGNVVLEAHASGLPAIVSERGGPQEIVRQYGSGLIANAESADSFAAAMRQLVTDDGVYRQCRAQALTTAHARSWEQVLERL